MTGRLAARILCFARADSPQQNKEQALIAAGYRFDFEHEPTKHEGHYISAIIELEKPIHAGETGEALIYLAVPNRLLEKFRVGDKGRLLRGYMEYGACEIVELVPESSERDDPCPGARRP